MTETSQNPAAMPTGAEGGITAALRSLIGTVPGSLLAWGLICSCAGAIPSLIRDRGMDDLGLAVFHAWLLHWIIAGIGLWGIVFVVLHVLCLHALLYTEASRRRVLTGAFLVQLTVSTIASGCLTDETSGYAWAAWAVVCSALLPWLTRPLFRNEKRIVFREDADRRSAAANYAAVKPFLLKGSRAQAFVPRCKRRYDRAEVTRILRAKVGRHLTDPRVAVSRGPSVNQLRMTT